MDITIGTKLIGIGGGWETSKAEVTKITGENVIATLTYVGPLAAKYGNCIGDPTYNDLGQFKNNQFPFWKVDEESSIVSSVNVGPSLSNQSAVVNNHTCGLCKNTRCNKQEKSCWRCGNQL